MNEEKKQNFWSKAGSGGLVLGGVSIAYFLTGILLQKAGVPQIAMSVSSVFLWILKFAGCIYLMWFFLKTEAASNGRERSGVLKYGMGLALCSALVYSAFYFAWVLFVQPDFFDQTFDALMQAYSQFLPAESLESIANMKSSMPTISFFTNLIWCWLYGTILSAILSSSLCRQDNPFAEGE